MEGNKVGVIEEDANDGMQCINHPHTKNPGGICAFCLQEKLGKLVSSSFPLPIITTSSSSSPPSPPSFRSDTLSTSSSSLSLSLPPKNNHDHNNIRLRLPFLLHKKKKKHSSTNPSSSSVAASSATSDVVFKRSKSTATSRRTHFLDDNNNAENEDFNFRKRNGFWSFLYLSSKPSSCSKKLEAKSFRECNSNLKISTLKPRVGSYLGRNSGTVVEEVDEEGGEGEESGSMEQRKVSRSRSVGCGSRSFSGDFFERISTGFGDCTLRRVESQREGNKVNKVGSNIMKERVRCGGIFGGFMMMTSSSSSTSSSSYWVSSSNVDDGIGRSNKNTWAWALASPIRAFTKNSSKDNKGDKNSTPNLSAVPSLLTVRV